LSDETVEEKLQELYDAFEKINEAFNSSMGTFLFADTIRFFAASAKV
jgi:hypothetical protein